MRTIPEIESDLAALRRPRFEVRLMMTPAAREAWQRTLEDWKRENPDGDARYTELLAEWDAVEQAEALAKRLAIDLERLHLPSLVRDALKMGKRGPLYEQVDAWVTSKTPWLVLMGPSGIGKSVAAGYGLHRQMRAGSRCRWQNAASLVREVGSTFDHDAQRRMEQVKHTECLVLDDVGAEHRSDFSAGLLFEVCQHRHEESLRTIITTNLSIEDLRARVGSRLYDRIRSAGVFAVGDGRSMRGAA